MPKKTKKLNNAISRDITIILDDLEKDDSLFRCNYAQIAKHLLKRYLPITDIWHADFETIKDAYIINIECQKKRRSRSSSELTDMIEKKITQETAEAIKSEDSFYKYICKRYFYLEKEPRRELLQLYMNATKHINEIDISLTKIDKKLKEIEAKNDTEEMQSLKPVFIYYQEMNIDARAEIIYFLTNEIKNYALNSCYIGLYSYSSIGKMPYRYAWNPKNFIPKIPSDISNKFGELVLSKFSELNKLYTTNKRKFNKAASKFIKDYAVLNQIINRLNENHILNERKGLIQEALKTYSKGSKIMFVNAVPSIIEGIFHDLCLLNGENDNELIRHGLQIKLNRLKGAMGHRLHYEYYSFRFRLIRNKAAHGRLKMEDINEYANFMLLDLYDDTGMVNIDAFDLNKKINLLRIIPQKNDVEKAPLVLKYLLLNSIAVPEFYLLRENAILIGEYMRTPYFWNYLDAQLDKKGEAIDGILFIVQILKKIGIDDASCKRLYKKIGAHQINEQQKELYFKYLS
jgi:hypothetical protein